MRVFARRPRVDGEIDPKELSDNWLDWIGLEYNNIAGT